MLTGSKKAENVLILSGKKRICQCNVPKHLAIYAQNVDVFVLNRNDYLKERVIN